MLGRMVTAGFGAMPPFMQVEPAIGMALHSTRAMLHGRGGEVWEMVRENFL
jgi:pyruvate dehydrogenase (quinone)